MPDAEIVVRGFLTLLEDGAADQAVALLAEDVEWRNTGLPTVRGKKRVGGLLRDMEQRRIRFEARLNHVATTGNVVLTDRTDVIKLGRFANEFWVCGTFEVRDGLITLWDDHFSLANFTKGAAMGVLRAIVPGKR